MTPGQQCLTCIRLVTASDGSVTQFEPLCNSTCFDGIELVKLKKAMAIYFRLSEMEMCPMFLQKQKPITVGMHYGRKTRKEKKKEN